MRANDDDIELFGMLADLSGDIVLRTDHNGFIQDASCGLESLGVDLSQMLLSPHLADLAVGSHAAAVREFHAAAIDAANPLPPITFPIAAKDNIETRYALSLRPNPRGHGTLGIMRSVEQTRGLEEKLSSTAVTDPLTGLPNRNALMRTLSDALISNVSGAVVLVEIDHFRAITLRFGQSMGDEVLGAFAHFLGTLSLADTIVARMEGERFALFMPQTELMQALTWTQDMISTFAAISADLAFESTQLTASAGLARLSVSIDSTLSRAELGVSVAKVSGGARTECGDWLHGCENAETIAARRSLVAAS